MSRQNNKKLILIIIIVLFFLSSAVWLGVNISVKAENVTNNVRDGYSKNDIRRLLETNSESTNVELYNEDGTMQMLQFPLDNFNEQDNFQNISKSPFNERKLIDSGKPDEQSIVITIMGDGFTATQQNSFINAATNVVENMLGNDKSDGRYPFNLFRDVFTVYAIEVISNESGVSRDADENNGHIVDNYFGSSYYYGSNSSKLSRALVVTNKKRVNEIKKPNSSMTIILCNSTRWGGTGGEFAVASLAAGFENIFIHEIAHSFGGLADEYYYPSDGAFQGREVANMTANNNTSTIKWKEMLGYKGTGIFPYSNGVNRNDKQFDEESDNWFRPHQNCTMRYSTSQFCPVCADELIRKMQGLVGPLFNVTALAGNNIRIIKLNTNISGRFEIPERLLGKVVTEIGDSVFKKQSELTRITIPKTVTVIGKSAFGDCKNLREVQINGKIQRISDQAFQLCSNLQSVKISDYVYTIGKEAFNGCERLTTFSSNSISEIGERAFQNCTSLKDIGSLRIVKHIRNSAFENCNQLNKELVFSTLQSIGDNVFRNCTNLTSVSLTGSLTSLGNGVFENCNQLNKIELGSTIQNIGNRAFLNCFQLTNFSVNSNLQNIGEEAFQNCSELSNVEFNSVISIGARAFQDCRNLQTISSLMAVKNIGAWAFNYCERVTIDSPLPSLQYIENDAFYGCNSLKEITELNQLKSIGNRAFAGCSQLSVISGFENLQKIGEWAFGSCNTLKNIYLPSTVSEIAVRAFAYCDNLNITVAAGNTNYTAEDNILYSKNKQDLIATGNTPAEILIPETVSTIYPYAFLGNKILSVVQFVSIVSVEEYAFSGCWNLNAVYFDLYSSPSLGKNAFESNNFTVYAPYGEQSVYRVLFSPYTDSIQSIAIHITLLDRGNVKSEQDGYYGSTVTGIKGLSRNGYIFEGWFGPAVNGEKLYLNGDLWESKSNVTLYAKWSAIPEYVQKFTSVGTHYVQNAYRSAESSAVSIDALAAHYRELGRIAAGSKLYESVDFYRDALGNPVRPSVVISGYVGTSVREEMEFIFRQLDLADRIFIAGSSLGTFYRAMGYNVGLGYVEEDLIGFAQDILQKAGRNQVELLWPSRVITLAGDGRSVAGMREIQNIPSDEIPYTTNQFYYESAGTAALFGYPIFFPATAFPDGVSREVVEFSQENNLAYVNHFEEHEAFSATRLLFFKDSDRLGNPERYVLYAQDARLPSFKEPLYRNLMTGGDSVSNIRSVLDTEYSLRDIVIMRVEMDIGFTDERMDPQLLHSYLSVIAADLEYLSEQDCKVILTASNPVRKTDRAERIAKDFGGDYFLDQCSRFFHREILFKPLDQLSEINSENGRIYWTSNLYPYES